MFDIDKILGTKKSTKLTELSMSKVFGKNPISDMIGGITKKPLHNLGASPKMQNKWKSFSIQKRNIIRKTHKDSDGDRIPNIFDCSPFNVMKQDTVYHGTTALAAMKIKKQGLLTSDELKAAGSPYHTLSEKTRPDKTYFFKDKARAESWAEVATLNSMFPNSSPTVVVADVPGDELFPDNLMETGGAFYKEGSVPASQIKDTYAFKSRRSVDDMNAFRKAEVIKPANNQAISKDGRLQLTTHGGGLMAKPLRDKNGNMVIDNNTGQVLTTPIFEGDPFTVNKRGRKIYK